MFAPKTGISNGSVGENNLRAPSSSWGYAKVRSKSGQIGYGEHLRNNRSSPRAKIAIAYHSLSGPEDCVPRDGVKRSTPDNNAPARANWRWLDELVTRPSKGHVPQVVLISGCRLQRLTSMVDVKSAAAQLKSEVQHGSGDLLGDWLQSGQTLLSPGRF
jgi:hypothetical protein